MTNDNITISPQKGPQWLFHECEYDIVIYGGSAGSGKSYALLMEAARNIDNPQYGGVIFRRTSPQIRNEGGLWDTSENIYPHIGGKPTESTLEWNWSKGARIKFTHMEH